MGAPVPGDLGVALCRARTVQVAAVVPCRARGGSWWRSPGAGESWRRDRPASGGSPRLESRDLERALFVSWASRLECVEDLSLPRVARFLTGRHVPCCL